MNTKLIIIWGENMAESAMRDFNHVIRARAAGAKLIVISPLYDATASKADWWIPIEPATDGALALALTRLLIEGSQYDADSVRRHTVAPFLVRADNGQFLRAGDILPLRSLGGDVGRSGGDASGWCRAYAPMLNPDCRLRGRRTPQPASARQPGPPHHRHGRTVAHQGDAGVRHQLLRLAAQPAHLG